MEWKAPEGPFTSRSFFQALQESGSIGGDSGWGPVFFEEEGHALYSFIKSHSYGEYIFDWQWARAYQESRLPYYPKLTSMVPFTPAGVPHFLMPKFDGALAGRLMDKFDSFYKEYNFSSSHFLFLKDEEIPFFHSRGYLIRESMQYHFFNEGFDSFADYLGAIKAKKAKHIQKERLHPDLEIRRYTGEELTREHALSMYKFYLTTIHHKHAIDYLKKDFFLKVFELMKDQLLYVEAKKNDRAIAGSLFFYGGGRLYGRYWGASEYVENLHFELCYYQGIDFCLEKNLGVFEAGAQGEHKIARGFRPVRTYSAHRLKHPEFHRAIEEYIRQEKLQVAELITELSQGLPFRASLI